MFKRLIAPVREFGLAAGSIYLFARLLRIISPRLGVYLYELMMQPVKAEPLLPARLRQNLKLVEIGPGHPDLARMPVREEIKVSRFEQGSHCIAVYRSDVLLGYCWFCFGAYLEDEVRCIYDLARAEPAAWDFDLYVFPEHRMGIGFSAVWHGAFEYLRARGIERSFSRVTQFNLASRRAHARLGSVRVGRVIFMKLGRLEAALASVRPYVGVTWKPGQKVVLKMPAPARTPEGLPGQQPDHPATRAPTRPSA